MRARDELFEALADIAEKYNVALTNSPDMHPGVPELGDFLGDIEQAIHTAGYRHPNEG